MSIYSGQDRDVYDEFGNYTNEQLKEMTFFVGDHPTPLRIESQKDLSPYYASSIIGQVPDKGRKLCRFTGTPSYVDDDIGLMVRTLKKYYKKSVKSNGVCKKNKAYQYIENNLYLFDDDVFEFVFNELQNNKNITVKEIEDKMYRKYRELLCDEMIRLGWREGEASCWNHLYDRMRKYQDKWIEDDLQKGLSPRMKEKLEKYRKEHPEASCIVMEDDCA